MGSPVRAYFSIVLEFLRIQLEAHKRAQKKHEIDFVKHTFRVFDKCIFLLEDQQCILLSAYM